MKCMSITRIRVNYASQIKISQKKGFNSYHYNCILLKIQLMINDNIGHDIQILVTEKKPFFFFLH